MPGKIQTSADDVKGLGMDMRAPGNVAGAMVRRSSSTVPAGWRRPLSSAPFVVQP